VPVSALREGPLVVGQGILPFATTGWSMSVIA
jgi:hypothetical protein